MTLHPKIQAIGCHIVRFYNDTPRRQLIASVAIPAVLAAILAVTVWLVRDTAAPPAPDFTQYEVGTERKEAFFGYFLPLIQQRNADLLELRNELQALHQDLDSLSRRQQRKALDVAEEYGLEEFEPTTPDGWDTLLRRVDIVPPSLALAQAANESAWGTSRFALDGNNYYGHWCFVEGCGLVPTSRPAGANHEVAAFDSPQHSVERYMHNLNNHDAYRELRLIRSQLRQNENDVNGLALVEALGRYSERGQHYIDELSSMIRTDDLTRYDVTDQP